jgi:hypothetical protein
MTDNGFKWAEDLMEDDVPQRSMSMYASSSDYYKDLLKEANARIAELEQAVEFWKTSFNLATEDYITMKDEYNDLLQRTGGE